jgi:Type IIA topoisomerase (DNA gyrase/topo II, topoisomerase IV), B subunit
MAYDDSSIEVIRDDIQRIRKRLNMYIGSRGWAALIHLVKEIVQNIVDEGTAPESDFGPGQNRCTEGIIDVDERTKTITMIDNGRGKFAPSVI